METKKIKSFDDEMDMPRHVQIWANQQQTIIEKAHRIDCKERRYNISPVMTIVRKW